MNMSLLTRTSSSNILLLFTQREVLQTCIRDSLLRNAEVDVFAFEVLEDGRVCVLHFVSKY